MRFLLILAAVTGLTAAICTAQTSSQCKPIEHYGVKGCELLPDRTCPTGYHPEAVNPPDPRMAGPTRLMCVPDKQPSQSGQSAKDDKPKQKQEPPPKSDHQ